MKQIPEKMKHLSLDTRGYPIPWFVANESDFRVVSGLKLKQSLKLNLCWVCGKPLGSFKAFVVGPMCAINRITSEPACHRECALYAVQTCPFLIKPHMHRVKETLPPDTVKSLGGIMVKENPGCCAIWITKRSKLLDDNYGGLIIEVGDPTEIQWFTEGRTANYDEVLKAINTSFSIMNKIETLPENEQLKLNVMYKKALKMIQKGR